jgi:hypothetical protein
MMLPGPSGLWKGPCVASAGFFRLAASASVVFDEENEMIVGTQLTSTQTDSFSPHRCPHVQLYTFYSSSRFVAETTMCWMAIINTPA